MKTRTLTPTTPDQLTAMCARGYVWETDPAHPSVLNSRFVKQAAGRKFEIWPAPEGRWTGTVVVGPLRFLVEGADRDPRKTADRAERYQVTLDTSGAPG